MSSDMEFPPISRGRWIQRFAKLSSALLLILICASWIVLGWVGVDAQEPGANAPAAATAASAASEASAPSTATTPATPAADSSPSSPPPAAESSSEKPVPPPEPPAPPPFEMNPYKVRVRISWPQTSQFPASRTEHLSLEVGRDLQARFRQHWVLDCQTSSASELETAFALQNARSEKWIERYGTSTDDKQIHVVVEQSGVLYTLTALEWCGNSQTLSPLIQLETPDPRDLAGLVADAAAQAFRPFGLLEISEGTKLEFRMRAGEFPPRDESLAPFQVGQYLVPYMRYLGRKRELVRIQNVPWTYLKVDQRERIRVRVETKSAFKQPLAGSRRRVEVMAILVRPSWESSEVRIFPRRSPNTPLVGYHCDIVDRLPTAEDPVPERDVYYTNRYGMIKVPVPTEGDPLRYLIVHSGQSVLVKLPILAGTAPHLEVEVPNDRARLGVEGEVSLLQGELIDIVATREVLMARARAAAKKQDWTSVDKFTTQLESLPTQEQFLGRISTLELTAVYQAQQAKDRTAEGRIKKLCGAISESARTHLDPGRIAEFRGEIRTTRQE